MQWRRTLQANSFCQQQHLKHTRCTSMYCSFHEDLNPSRSIFCLRFPSSTNPHVRPLALVHSSPRFVLIASFLPAYLLLTPRLIRYSSPELLSATSQPSLLSLSLSLWMWTSHMAEWFWVEGPANLQEEKKIHRCACRHPDKNITRMINKDISWKWGLRKGCCQTDRGSAPVDGRRELHEACTHTQSPTHTYFYIH